MAKPRIFISSTCYDLSMVRNELSIFLNQLSFEVINSEHHSFGVSPGKHPHTVCIDEVANADYLLLIIGKRRGSTFIGSEKSITNEEYNKALSLNIPRIICVLKEVDEYRLTYKKNPDGDHSHIVDDERIFDFIDYISSGESDNWIHKFETIDDIKSTLTSQFAHYLFLFSKMQKISTEPDESKLIIASFPSNLEKLKQRDWKDHMEEEGVRNGLRSLYEIISNIISSDMSNAFKIEKLKFFWIMGRYGEPESLLVGMKIDAFEQFAWSYSRQKRIFYQLEPFGVEGDLIQEEGYADLIYVGFSKFTQKDSEVWVPEALCDYVKTLLKKYSEKDAYRFFCTADMNCYSIE